jgi:hypothetical protein
MAKHHAYAAIFELPTRNPADNFSPQFNVAWFIIMSLSKMFEFADNVAKL